MLATESSCAVLWIRTHLLAACGLVLLAEVGWLVRDYIGTLTAAGLTKGKSGPSEFGNCLCRMAIVACFIDRTVCRTTRMRIRDVKFRVLFCRSNTTAKNSKLHSHENTHYMVPKLCSWNIHGGVGGGGGGGDVDQDLLRSHFLHVHVSLLPLLTAQVAMTIRWWGRDCSYMLPCSLQTPRGGRTWLNFAN